MSGEATNEIYIFFTSRDEIKVMFMKTFEFLLLLKNFSEVHGSMNAAGHVQSK